jgi:hypothetical protein
MEGGSVTGSDAAPAPPAIPAAPLPAAPPTAAAPPSSAVGGRLQLASASAAKQGVKSSKQRRTKGI